MSKRSVIVIDYDEFIAEKADGWAVKVIRALSFDNKVPQRNLFPIFLTDITSSHIDKVMTYLVDECQFTNGRFSLMGRKDGDNRHYWDIKRDTYKRFIDPKCNVVFAMDNEANASLMWHNFNIPVLDRGTV